MNNLTAVNGLVAKRVLIMTLLAVMLVMVSNYVQAQTDFIKVGLINETKNLKINAVQGISLKTSDGYSLKLDSAAGFQFKKMGQFVRINNYFFTSDHISIAPLGDQLLKINARDYKGTIKLINNNEAMTVVNKVGMTDYLASVIGSEIDPKWPLAALKAQAVVARTYALRNLNSHASKGYNLSNTIYSQAYKGDHVTTPKVYQAVEETVGEVLTYQGQLISAVYHSNAGGKTAQGAVIWEGETPYLQSVRSKDHYAPNYQWQKRYNSKRIEEILNAKGISIGSIEEISLKNLGPSGRAREVFIIGDERRVSIDSSKFRFWLQLRSTKFSINKFNQVYVFKGKGWGHGVGMSQWGAYQMAREGATYQDILEHYYQNIKLVKKDFGGIDDES